ncbi:MAG: hypothetical protein AAFW84_30405 [Cyanobacteria bacterium J06635_15]
MAHIKIDNLFHKHPDTRLLRKLPEESLQQFFGGVGGLGNLEANNLASSIEFAADREGDKVVKKRPAEAVLSAAIETIMD